MAPWKQIVLKAFGVGIGIGVGFAFCVASYAWYSSRPKPQRPWDANAVTASFEYADTATKDNHLRFLYILENHTDEDYRATTADLIVSAVVQEKDSLAATGHVTFQDDKIFLPSKQHVFVVLELPNYHFPGEKASDNADERKKYRESVEKYVNDELPRLNGFAAFDEINRYRINFPNGWRSSKSQ